ncbi:hypothetical protein BpHYR1_026543 [Brachionus plicatilis]|uniref:Uncharacterized protein n=1 Tax=Brachionus plicatilis TaxID=10195 RepID=A0A3M7P730_BRAPC|nr:hypothetical protein BpHYR1_026543 [Brachionus plicatilis]
MNYQEIKKYIEICIILNLFHNQVFSTDLANNRNVSTSVKNLLTLFNNGIRYLTEAIAATELPKSHKSKAKSKYGLKKKIKQDLTFDL